MNADELIDGTERALIGAWLTDPRQPRPPLQPEEFFLERHRLLWRTFGELEATGLRPDLALVSQHLRSTGQLDEGGGPAYLAQCVEEGCLAMQVDGYARLVREAARSRGLRRLGQELMASGATVEEVERRLSELPTALTLRHLPGVRLWESIQLAWLEAPILLGIPPVDRLARLMRGDLMVIGGRTSMGKTALLVSATVRLLEAGHSVAYYSLETPAEAVWRRLIAAKSRVGLAGLRYGALGATDFQLANEASEWLSGQPLTVRDVRALGSKTAPRILEAFASERAEVVILDHVQEVVTDSDNRAFDLGQFVARLKERALVSEVVMIVAAQLSRLTDRHRGLPVLGELKETGGLEEKADVVLLLHHWVRAGDQKRAPDELEVVVAKNRDGATGRITVRFDVRTSWISMADSSSAPAGPTPAWVRDE